MLSGDRELRCRAHVEELMHRLILGEVRTAIPPGANILFVDEGDPGYTAWSLALADELQAEGRTVVLLDAHTCEERALQRLAV
ncbi:MAG: hypothetical protein HY331_13575 [Chloroflexi bacterium]|nr:hypothetical protein [Chloroflexota bacterium]